MEYKSNRNGEGTWRETASGNKEYRFTYRDEYGNRKVKSVTGVSVNHCLERAEEFLDRLRQKLEGIILTQLSLSCFMKRLRTTSERTIQVSRGMREISEQLRP